MRQLEFSLEEAPIRDRGYRSLGLGENCVLSSVLNPFPGITGREGFCTYNSQVTDTERNSGLVSQQIGSSGEQPCDSSDWSKASSQAIPVVELTRSQVQDKPYKCTDCGKSFNHNAHLTVHKRIDQPLAALIGLLPSMLPLMLGQGGAMPEALPTVVTLVGPLLSVSPQMQKQASGP